MFDSPDGPADDAEREAWTARGVPSARRTVGIGLVAAATAALIAAWIDSLVGDHVSVRAVVTAGAGGGTLAVLWIALQDGAGEHRLVVRRLLALATASFCLVLLVYLLAQRSRSGQRFERDVLLGRTSGRLEPPALRLLDELTIGTVLFFGVVIALLAAIRRRVRLGEAVGIAILLAVGSAAILKQWLLPRPLLLDDHAIATVTSYPSGHVTAAAALAAALVVVVAPRWRRRAAFGGGALVALTGIAVLITGWHRPSDAVGGVLLATAWISLAAAVTTRREPPVTAASVHTASINARTWRTAGYLATAAFLLLAVVELSRLAGAIDRPQHIAAFLAGSAAFLAVDVVAYAVLAGALDPSRPPPTTR